MSELQHPAKGPREAGAAKRAHFLELWCERNNVFTIGVPRLRHYDSEKALASALETAPRTLYRWLHDGQTVQLDVVDRALVSEGSALLVELYPLDDEQAA